MFRAFWSYVDRGWVEGKAAIGMGNVGNVSACFGRPGHDSDVGGERVHGATQRGYSRAGRRLSTIISTLRSQLITRIADTDARCCRHVRCHVCISFRSY